MRRMTQTPHLLIATLMLATAGSAIADSITFYSSSIPLRDCRISAIQSGRIQYVDPNNRRQMRDIREIRALSFDNLEALDEAEVLVNANRGEEAVVQLLRALRAAETDVQRLWIRYRLASVHDALGQYVQTVAHVAEVFRMTGSVDWEFLKPISAPGPAPYAAAREAMTNLERAHRDVRSPQLRSKDAITVTTLYFFTISGRDSARCSPHSKNAVAAPKTLACHCLGNWS